MPAWALSCLKFPGESWSGIVPQITFNTHRQDQTLQIILFCIVNWCLGINVSWWGRAGTVAEEKRNSLWNKDCFPGFSSQALCPKCRDFYSLLSAMNPALLFLLERMNWLNIYPGSWTQFYSMGRRWPSLEWVWICLHHSCRRNLTDFCWASLLVCMKDENAAPDLSHTFVWKPFSLFLKSSEAHFNPLKIDSLPTSNSCYALKKK